ncbi:TPA: aryl-sulfate sulfotransferase, partial [Pseudomonas aeruginosa]
VWRLGPNLPPIDPKSARKLPRPVDQISGQHDAHLIPEGLPGAGNLLVFDNQGDAGYPSVQRGLVSGSRVLEIDPLKKQIVWQYTAEDSQQPGWAFYSAFISSARRLPNGNTLIDEGQNGRFFQVTPGGEIVWEYVSPYFGKAPRGDARSNWVYRALPVAYAWVPEGTPREEKAVNLAVPGATPQVTARR